MYSDPDPGPSWGSPPKGLEGGPSVEGHQVQGYGGLSPPVRLLLTEMSPGPDGAIQPVSLTRTSKATNLLTKHH